MLLLDEPCSALDPIATAKIEDLLFTLKDQCTIVIVTHNMQQAARVADSTGFFLLGKLIEFDKTEIIFKKPRRRKPKITSPAGSDRALASVRRKEQSLVHFREELDELQRRLLEMAGLVESAIHQSVSALVERDDQLAKEVLWKEAQINQKDIEIDEFATRLLALYQPMARDMRFLTAAIKINGDLERMGDLAVNITERALSLMKEPPVKPLIDIPQMADLAEAMVRKAWMRLSNATSSWRAACCSPTTKWIICATPSTKSWWRLCRKKAPPSRAPST